MSAPRLVVLALRGLLAVLPLAALALALPEVPHWEVLLGVLVSGAAWAHRPDGVAGAVALVLVGGWWAAHGVLDWRVPVVAVLLVVAHVVATVLALGPPTLPLDRALAALWAGRAMLVLVPVPVAWLALRGLDPAAAPPWLWLVVALALTALLVTSARQTSLVHDDRG